jgi:hypothetical protein
MLSLLTAAGCSLAFAGNWSGKLLDAPCYYRQAPEKPVQDKIAETCMATSQSTAFVVKAAGKVYHLDSAGNLRAVAALNNRADRTAPGQAHARPKEITVKLEGSESGGTITVSSIELQ